ncbi:MAG: tRNA pseudouridine(38-40) synthase TruA [Legionellales bacterium]|nr:tRNA pseudouridine(38-40) synthase TruA [Legionellales bacterium]|tara:strand:- start:1682 stop:2482 length:801 start_codon:yes stop_codon:yes gene_type:complete
MRHALGIAYLGTQYFGWQSQPDQPTVQAFVEKALSFVADEPIRVYCSGRTDRGVHATNQVIHFDSNAQRSTNNWLRGVNAALPDDIQVVWHRVVDETFHARHCALSRQYTYLLYVRPTPNVIWSNHALMIPNALDIKAMRQGAKVLVGEHDFSSFRAAHCQAKSPCKTLYSIEIDQYHHWMTFSFHANAFLYHMIRIMMHAILEIGYQKKEIQWLESVLKAKNRSLATAMVPPNGLYFQGAQYHKDYDIPQFKDILGGDLRCFLNQ